MYFRVHHESIPHDSAAYKPPATAAVYDFHESLKRLSLTLFLRHHLKFEMPK